jgi:hypothetical protein
LRRRVSKARLVFSIDIGDRGFGLPDVAVFVLDVSRSGTANHYYGDDFPAAKTSLFPVL